MRYNHALLIMIFTLLFVSCKKEHTDNPATPPPPDPVMKVLLKDITIPNLPTPYYHFEYNADSTVNRVEFDSGLTMYNVLYNGNRIGEMRNNIVVNHDTLRYVYDAAGKLTSIQFVNEANIFYRLVVFDYEGNQVKEIDWAHIDANSVFIADRKLTFTYHPDGNVKTIIERRADTNGTMQLSYTRQFDQYDDKINVDDFSLIHDGIHDHLFLLQGFRLQKNNPLKETYTGGVDPFGYTADYTYLYRGDNTPILKTGDLLFTAGADAGKRFQTNSVYTYY